MKIRVLQIAPSLGVHGGIEAVTTSIAEECAGTKGLEVRVLFRLRKGSPVRNDFEALLKGATYPTRTFRINFLIPIIEIWRSDLVHCHYPFWWAWLIITLLRKPYVITAINKTPPKNQFVLSVEKFVLRNARVSFYISSFVLSTWGNSCDGKKHLVIPATTYFKGKIFSQQERRGFILLTRLVPEKGASGLIQAYHLAAIDHQQNPLHIVGTGPLLEELKREVMRLGNKNITFHGYVSDELKVSLISNVRWNVAPQTFPEDLGMTPIEASLCDVPSIVSNIGGLPEAAGPGAILVEAGNIAELTDALERAASMGAEEYGDRCRLNQDYLKNYLKPLSYYPNCYRELLNPQKETDLH